MYLMVVLVTPYFACTYLFHCIINRVAHGSLFSSIFASFFVSFFATFGGRFHHLAGGNGMKITIKNNEKRLL